MMLRLLLISALVALAFGDDDVDHTTDIKKHPYQVSVEELNTHKCSGALIKPNVVITVAHCVAGKKPSSITVRAGSGRSESGGETSTVSRLCIHEDYSSSNKDYDVAALLLSRSFTLTVKIKPVNLVSKTANLPAGEVATVTGWRLFKERGTELEKAEVTRIAHQACLDAYPDLEITSRMTCYKAAEKDCKTDYGAPLVRGEGTEARQLGLMSWGARGVCGDADYPAVYTNIADAEIHTHINQCFATFRAYDEVL